MRFLTTRYLAGLVLLAAVGCELAETSGDGQSSATPGDATTVDAEWAAIQWHGESCAGAVQVMNLSASISGGQVHFSWDAWHWGSSMGLGHFFWWNGTTWQGGKFDWIRSPGQSVKGLENIEGGYNGLHAPPSGTRVAFAWTSEDGDERSNLATTTWP